MKIYIEENAFENIVWEMAATCLGLSVLINHKKHHIVVLCVMKIQEMLAHEHDISRPMYKSIA